MYSLLKIYLRGVFMEELICIVCGNKIVQPKFGKKRTLFCSNECYVKDYHNNNPKYQAFLKKLSSDRLEKYGELLCKFCGKPIVQSSGKGFKRVYCSSECKRKSRCNVSKEEKEKKSLYDKEYRKKRIEENPDYYKRELTEKVQYNNRVCKLSINFKLTEDMYRDMLDKQKGCCAICGRSLDSSAHVDHCHNSNKIRGVLCRHCNTGLGMFKDNIDFMKKAILYLENYG